MILDAAKVTEDEIKKLLGGGKTGGDGEKSPFQKAIEQLQEQQKELANTNTAYNKLKRAGMDTASAFEMASNPILAAAIATTKVGTPQWEKLLGLINQVNAALKKAELKNFFETRNAELEFKQDFAAIIPILQQLGVEGEDIRDIFSNEKLAKRFIEDLADGKLDAERLKNYILQIPEMKKFDLIINVKSIEEQIQDGFSKAMEYFQNELDKIDIEFRVKLETAQLAVDVKQQAVDAAQKVVDAIQEEIDGIQRQIDVHQRFVTINFDRPMEALQEEVSDLQRRIELEIDRPIEAINKAIEKLQRDIEMQFDRPIAALQEESSDLANDLTLMDKTAQAINEKYDAQEKALQKISDINQDLLNQDKSRLSIADALSRGDIAAAAEAAQQAREQAAQAAAQRAGGVLQRAREAEIAGIRGPVSGLTRSQIEQRQFDIGQQIFNLEEKRDIVQAQILTKQDEIFKIEQNRLPLLELIRQKEDQIYALQEAKEDYILRNIRPLEDALYEAQERLKKAQDDLKKAQDDLKAAQKAADDLEADKKKKVDAINAQKQAWEDAKVAIDNAKLAAEGVDKAVRDATGNLAGLTAGWSAMAEAAKAAALKVAGLGIPGITPTKNIYGGSDADYDRSLGVNRNFIPFTGKMYGGKVKKMAMGGIVGGTGMTDKVPTMLTPGEFVVNKQATKKFGPLLSAINGTKYPQMLQYGGMVGKSGSFSSPSFGPLKNNLSAPSYSSGSRSMPIKVSGSGAAPIVSDNSNTVYNYHVGINVSGTNINPNSIAQAVMNEIKYVDSQRIRGQRV